MAQFLQHLLKNHQYQKNHQHQSIDQKNHQSPLMMKKNHQRRGKITTDGEKNHQRWKKNHQHQMPAEKKSPAAQKITTPQFLCPKKITSPQEKITSREQKSPLL